MQYPAALSTCPLFDSILPDELSGLLSCLNARRHTYQKHEILIHAGEPLQRFGIVSAGRLAILKQDHTGRSAILSDIMPGELFAEAFVCGEMPCSVSVEACEKSEVFWVEYTHLMSPCDKNCKFHRQLTLNLIRILARRNVFLTGRLEHLTQRTLREKVQSYLEELSQKQGSPSVTVPFDPQRMADYLACDRSTLSYVLSQLKKEGLIRYHKNQFTLL